MLKDIIRDKIPGSERMDPTIKIPGRSLDGRTWDEVPEL